MREKIFMIAGPNGSGKTTIALELLQKESFVYEFLNADEIAKGLAPQHPESVALQASKLLLQQFLSLLNAKKSFAFETTGSGKNYIKHLQRAQEMGYEILLLFLWVSSPEEAVQRVAQRVQQGGHHIPKDHIVRRYYSGIKNLLQHYLPLVQECLIINNSTKAPLTEKIVATKTHNKLDIIDVETWNKIQRTYHEG